MPTTIHDHHAIIINGGDVIAMEKNTGFIVIIRADLSVSRLPVFVGVDCIDHLRFDLTHDEKRRELSVSVGWSVIPSR